MRRVIETPDVVCIENEDGSVLVAPELRISSEGYPQVRGPQINGSRTAWRDVSGVKKLDAKFDTPDSFLEHLWFHGQSKEAFSFS